MKNLKYSKILKFNKELGTYIKSDFKKIKILSNIIVHQIKEILEYPLRVEGINAIVEIGNYDNIVQDSEKCQDSNVVIIFWELCNIVEYLHVKIELLNNKQLNEIFEKTKSEINFVLKNLGKTALILINRFTSLHFDSFNIRNNNFKILAIQLNQYLENIIPTNVKLVELEKVMSIVGLDQSLNFRYYNQSKALYTIYFFKIYAQFIIPYIMSANGKSKKAIIFDCDNTLWKGILGEDGFNNIEMSTRTKDGAVFYEIQTIALGLGKQGVLIGLCSKNNPDDIEQVIKFHPDMQLKSQHITINKSNWFDKVSNLREISKELNIGLESLVFVDDSLFEVNLVREQLPEITVLQVPERLYEYPKMLRENNGLFYNFSITIEDGKKIEMYKQQIKRKSAKKEFGRIEDYLESLKMNITIHRDDEAIIPRMSQMCQKTNQFNLTTKRYTEGDIKHFLNNDFYEVIAISASDKFGDNGITGLCIIYLNDETQSAEIDTFLLSCRIIGRNIEYVFMDYLVHSIINKNIKSVTAKYIKTLKNEQVEDFYNNCSFALNSSSDSFKEYILKISNYEPKQLKYIKVING